MAFCLSCFLAGGCKGSLLCPQSVGIWIMDFHMVSGNSMDRGHPHGLQCQHMPRTSAWSLVAIQIMDINVIVTQPSAICPGVEMSTVAQALIHQDNVTIDSLKSSLIWTILQLKLLFQDNSSSIKRCEQITTPGVFNQFSIQEIIFPTNFEI